MICRWMLELLRRGSIFFHLICSLWEFITIIVVFMWPYNIQHLYLMHIICFRNQFYWCSILMRDLCVCMLFHCDITHIDYNLYKSYSYFTEWFVTNLWWLYKDEQQIKIMFIKGILKLILVIFCISWKLAIGSINDIYETLTRFFTNEAL